MELNHEKLCNVALAFKHLVDNDREQGKRFVGFRFPIDFNYILKQYDISEDDLNKIKEVKL